MKKNVIKKAESVLRIIEWKRYTPTPNPSKETTRQQTASKIHKPTTNGTQKHRKQTHQQQHKSNAEQHDHDQRQRDRRAGRQRLTLVLQPIK